MESENIYSFKREIKKSSSEILLDDCDLSIRAYQFLKWLNIANLGELSNFTEEELSSKSPAANKKTMQEIRSVLTEHGLEFKQ